MRDCVVLLRPHLASDTLTKRDFSNDLGGGGQTQQHVQCLHGVARDGKIAGGEDQNDNAGVADSSGTRVLPREQIVEEGVVVGEVLAIGCLGLRCLTRGGQVAELVLGCRGLGARLISKRAVGDLLHRLRVLYVLHRLLNRLRGVCEDCVRGDARHCGSLRCG